MILIIGTTIVILIGIGSIYQIHKGANSPANGEVETLKCLEEKIKNNKVIIKKC